MSEEIFQKLEKIDNKLNELSKNQIEEPVKIHEVAEFLGVNDIRTVYKRMNEGLPHHKAGNLTRFFLSEVKEWLQNR